MFWFEVVFNCSIFSFELVLDATKAGTATLAVRKYGSIREKTEDPFRILS